MGSSGLELEEELFGIVVDIVVPELSALENPREAGQLPNFVTVDFYDVGDLFSVVDALNGL